MKDDRLISLNAAIDTLDVGAELLRRVLDDTNVVGAEREKYEWGLGLIESSISDIKDLPSVQPDFDTDQKINKAYDDGYDQGYLQCKADQEKTTGHWIERRKKGSCYWQSWCSVCGKHSGIGGIESNRHKPFCPNCGSPMSDEVEWEI